MPDVTNPDNGEPQEDAELTDLASLASFDDTAARRILTERGLTEAEIDLIVGGTKKQAEVNAKLLARQQRIELNTYRDGLVTEYKLPDGKLIQGTTKREMLNSAKSLRAFADSVAAAIPGASAAAAAAAGTTVAAAATAAERGKEWVSPPAAASETVRPTPGKSWGDMKSFALNASGKPATKAEIFADLKENGPAQIERQSFTGILARKQPAKTP